MPFDEFATRGRMLAVHRIMRRLPSNPRCKVCFAPFSGPGGRIVRFAGFGRSRKNPNFCDACFEKAPLGGEEMEIGILFADIRGYTALTETSPPAEIRRLLARFYDNATDALMEADALIDKMVGDEVMALFIPMLLKGNVASMMIETAKRMLEGFGFAPERSPWCPVGIGLDYGMSFVGNVGAGEVKDFTAIGDVVNTAARLQGEAAAGQIVMSARVYDDAQLALPDARRAQLTLKGKQDAVDAYVLDLSKSLTPS